MFTLRRCSAPLPNCTLDCPTKYSNRRSAKVKLHARRCTANADLELEFNRPNKVTQMSTRYGMIVDTDGSILRWERSANLTSTVIERFSVANSLIDTLQLQDFTTLTTVGSGVYAAYWGLLMTQLGGERFSRSVLWFGQLRWAARRDELMLLDVESLRAMIGACSRCDVLWQGVVKAWLRVLSGMGAWDSDDEPLRLIDLD